MDSLEKKPNNESNNVSFKDKFLQHLLREPNLRKSQILAFHGLLSAIIIVFLVIPIAIGPVSMAFLPLVAIIISTQFMGLKHGIISGAVFGLTSLVLAFTTFASTPMAVFQNPMVSLLPRMAIPFAIYFVSLLLKTKIKEPIVSDLIASIGGVITNTALVLLMIFIFYFNRTVQGTAINGAFILGLVSINSLIEIVFCAVVAPPIMRVLRKVITLGS